MHPADPRNALHVCEAVEEQHPEIAISSPLTSQSGHWELDIEGETTAYSDFWLMVDYLSDRYGTTDDEHGKPRQ